MSGTLSWVLKNPKIQRDIQEAIRVCNQATEGIFTIGGITYPTLMDHLTVVDYGIRQRRTPITQADYLATKAALNPNTHPLSASTMDFQTLGVYDMVQQSMLINRRKFTGIVAAADRLDELNDPDIKPYKVEEISLLGNSPTTLLAINNFYSYKGLENEDHHFYGSLAATGPVMNFFEKFLGLNSPTQIQVNQWTFKIAEEVGMSPLMVNVGMWVIGQR